jgi:hypothetical protein
MITSQPSLTPRNQYKQVFNLKDFNKKRTGYVTYADLEDYANLYSGNTFLGALNVFQYGQGTVTSMYRISMRHTSRVHQVEFWEVQPI